MGELIKDYLTIQNIVSFGVLVKFVICGLKDRIGYATKLFFNNRLYSFLLTFVLMFFICDFDKFRDFKFTYSNLFVVASIWITVNYLVFLFVAFFRSIIDSFLTCPVFSYVKASVENNIVDYYLLKASVSGDILNVVTHSDVVYLLFQKYSSSYDCKITEKKFCVAYVFKKGYLSKDNKIDFFEDNSIELLNKFNNYEAQIRDQNITHYIFEPRNYNNQSRDWFCRLLFGNPYPSVPFYQILDEYEERIDFKDIKSISIYRCHQNDEQKD